MAEPPGSINLAETYHLGFSTSIKYRDHMPTTKLKQIFFGHFEDQQEEQLYQKYMRKQKLKIIPSFVAITILYLLSRLALEAAVSSDIIHMTRVLIHAVFIVLTILVLALMTLHPDMSKRASNMCVIALWVLVMSSLLVDVAVLSHPLEPSGLVGWVQVIIFTTFVVVPWKLRHCVGMSVGISLVHSAELLFLWFSKELTRRADNSEFPEVHIILYEEIVADSLLFLGAISLGILVFAFSERKQRRSFLESKKSHVISYEIEKEHKEQKRLLESVLPKYVAHVMMRDIANISKTESTDELFRKIYMQRFENVSILFADIVGFTAISSSVTAAELVKILNQLFANFDSLGHKYHQQRIKILGDCYYCVCGISKVDIRPDHAVLCIHMGMSMVDAISAVRRDTGKEVNMRVGIHTGSVLAGVMGQKQWQYDVLGQQVIMANHLESGGLPARVHISETTKQQLEGQFELEPGNGQDRDSYLKLENMQSYLVKSIIKKYPEGTLDADPALLATLRVEAAKKRTGSSEEMESQRTESSLTTADRSSSPVSHHYTLKDALFDKKRSLTAMEKLSFLTTWFHDRKTEDRYRKRREYFSGASLGALALILCLSTIAKFTVLPIRLVTIVVVILAEVILIFMALVSSVSVLKWRWIPNTMRTWGQIVEGKRLARMMWGLCSIFILIVADFTTILQCDVARAVEMLKNVTTMPLIDHDDPVCVVPAYFVYIVHLILLGVCAVVQIEHMTKVAVILLCAATYTILCIVFFAPIFDYNDAAIRLQGKTVPSKYDLSAQLMTAALAILIINRKMEEISRRLFIWREEAKSKMEQAREERCRTEGLIYNILPEHVARYFIGQTRDHMDLYHHGYDDVAVMFAACPNFHDFYNESDINNQGLECLRLLHEIISDYDELLDKPCFKATITKIKTVGPTYMAASGMVTTPNRRPSALAEGLVRQYQHVDDMVQFALAMKELLKKINEQSFNTFLLRIGINHGPIIAGVIGVTKPHYDIWGNTVNVASRMESTGMPDQIQVVEETKEVLEHFGYFFQKRGRIKVKGKGMLTTYFLLGQDKNAIKDKLLNIRRMSSSVDSGTDVDGTQSYGAELATVPSRAGNQDPTSHATSGAGVRSTDKVEVTIGAKLQAMNNPAVSTSGAPTEAVESVVSHDIQIRVDGPRESAHQEITTLEQSSFFDSQSSAKPLFESIFSDGLTNLVKQIGHPKSNVSMTYSVDSNSSLDGL